MSVLELVLGALVYAPTSDAQPNKRKLDLKLGGSPELFNSHLVYIVAILLIFGVRVRLVHGCWLLWRTQWHLRCSIKCEN
jgi:hypothetical protein